MSSSPDDLPASTNGAQPGLRAARQRRNLTQEQAAALVNAPLSSYRRWDRGANPRDPEMAQALAEALDTPIEVIWPPEDNAHVNHALRALREQRAHEAAEAALADPPATPGLLGPPVVEPERTRTSSVPDPREIIATLDGHDTPPRIKTRRATRRRRLTIPATVGVVAVLGAATAIATAGDDRPAAPTAPAAVAQPSPAQRKRAAQQAALGRARSRGDFNEALAIAQDLNDTATVKELQADASGVLARRAKVAAERGDLVLARARLDKAEERYGKVAVLRPVRQRIAVIQDARTARAAQRKAAAKKRAARARAAAAARRATPAPSVAAAGSSGSAATQATPSSAASSSSSAPSRAPVSPSPATSGGGKTSSGGSSSAENEFGYLGG